MWMGVFCPEKVFEMDLEDKIKFWMTEGRKSTMNNCSNVSFQSICDPIYDRNFVRFGLQNSYAY